MPRRSLRFRRRVLGVRGRFAAKVQRALRQEIFCFDRWIGGHAVTYAGPQYPASGAGTKGWSCPATNNSLNQTYVTAAVAGCLFPIIPHKGIQTIDQSISSPATWSHARRGNKITIRRIKVSGQFCGPDQGGGSDPNDLFPAWVRVGLAYYSGPNIESADIRFTHFFDDSTGVLGTGVNKEARVQLPRIPYSSAVASTEDYSQSEFKVIKNRIFQLQRAPATAEGSTAMAPLQQQTFRWNLACNKTVVFNTNQSAGDVLNTLDRNWYIYLWSSLDDLASPTAQQRVLLNWMHIRVYYSDA